MAKYKVGEIITIGTKNYRVESSLPCKLCALHVTAECGKFGNCHEVLGEYGYLVEARKKEFNP